MAVISNELLFLGLDTDSTIDFLKETINERNGMSFSVYDSAFVVASKVLDPENQKNLKR